MIERKLYVILMPVLLRKIVPAIITVKKVYVLFQILMLILATHVFQLLEIPIIVQKVITSLLKTEVI